MMKFKEASTDTQTEKTKQEQINKMTEELEESIEIKGSFFSGTLAPDLKRKITQRIERSQSQTIEKESTQKSDESQDLEISIPAHAIVTVGNLTQQVTESYRQSGTITMDAEIRYVNAPNLHIGKWSDYVSDEKMRTMPVVAEYRITSSHTVRLRDPVAYATQQECEMALKRGQEPQIRFQALAPIAAAPKPGSVTPAK